MSLLDKLLKSGSDAVKASVLTDSEFFKNRIETHTSIPALNIALGGSLKSGLKSGLLMVSGASKSFKTCISLYMVAAYLKKYKDAICIFYDTEFGATPSYFKNFGIDTDRVLHIPIEHIEQLKFDIVNRLKEVTKKERVIVFIDSVGNIASKKEVEDAIEEKSAADMTRAKALKSLWRITTPMFTMREIPCIAINHIYMEQGCLDGSTIVITDTGSKKISEIEIGDKVLTDKNRFKEVTYAYSPDQISSKDKKFFEVEFDDGSVIRATGNHQFLMADLSWKRLDEISEKDEFHVSMFNQGGLNVQADDKNAQ